MRKVFKWHGHCVFNILALFTTSLHRYSGRTLKEIGACFGVVDSAVSKTSQRFAETMGQDKRIVKQIERLSKELGLFNVHRLSENTKDYFISGNLAIKIHCPA